MTTLNKKTLFKNTPFVRGDLGEMRKAIREFAKALKTDFKRMGAWSGEQRDIVRELKAHVETTATLEAYLLEHQKSGGDYESLLRIWTGRLIRAKHLAASTQRLAHQSAAAPVRWGERDSA